MGTAVTGRNTEPSRVSKRNISAPFSRRLQQGESKKVRSHCDQGLRGMDRLRKSSEILDLTIQIRVIEKDPAKI